MTRRNAIITLLVGPAGMVTHIPAAETLTPKQGETNEFITIGHDDNVPRFSIVYDLDKCNGIEIKRAGKSVILSVDEIWNAVKG